MSSQISSNQAQGKRQIPYKFTDMPDRRFIRHLFLSPGLHNCHSLLSLQWMKLKIFQINSVYSSSAGDQNGTIRTHLEDAFEMVSLFCPVKDQEGASPTQGSLSSQCR